MEEPKFCKDCKHYKPPQAYYRWQIPAAQCERVENLYLDLESGYQLHRTTPRQLRATAGACGEEARLFEAAPPVLTAPPPKRGFLRFVGL